MWKKYFSDEDIKIGYEYFKENAVDNFNYSNGSISAQVADYNVFINFKDEGIDSMYCDCRIKGCKHQAAVLHYLDSHPQRDYSNLISSFTHNELVHFLSKELPNNPELLTKLELYKNMDVDSNFYKKRLYKCFSSYVKVINFINVDLGELKITGQIDLLLTLLKEIVEYLYELNDIGMYDEYDVILGMIGHLICNLLDLGYDNKVLKFLEEFILNSEDETVSDYFAYIYSHVGDVEALF